MENSRLADPPHDKSLKSVVAPVVVFSKLIYAASWRNGGAAILENIQNTLSITGAKKKHYKIYFTEVHVINHAQKTCIHKNWSQR